MGDLDAGSSMTPSEQDDTPLSGERDGFSWEDGRQEIDEWYGWDLPVEVENTLTENLLDKPHKSNSEPTIVTNCEDSPIHQRCQDGVVDPSLAEVATVLLADCVTHSDHAPFGTTAHNLSDDCAGASFSSSPHTNEAALQYEMTTGLDTRLSDALANDGRLAVGIESNTVCPSPGKAEPESGTEMTRVSLEEEVGMNANAADLELQFPSTRRVEAIQLQPNMASVETSDSNNASMSNFQLTAAATSPYQSDGAISSQPTTTDPEPEISSPDFKDHELHTSIHGKSTNVVEEQFDSAFSSADGSTDIYALSPSQVSPDPEVGFLDSARANLRIFQASTSFSNHQPSEPVSPEISETTDPHIARASEVTQQDEEPATVEQEHGSVEVEVAMLNHLSPDPNLHDKAAGIASTDAGPDEKQLDVEPNEGINIVYGGGFFTQNVDQQVKITSMAESNDMETLCEQNLEVIMETIDTEPKKLDEEANDTGTESDGDFLPVQFSESTRDNFHTTLAKDAVDGPDTVGSERSSNSIGQINEANADGNDSSKCDALDVQQLGQDGEDMMVSKLSRESDVTPPPTPGPEEFEFTPLHPVKKSPTNPVEDIPDIYSKTLPFMTAAQERFDNEAIEIGSTASTDDPTRPLLEALAESEAIMSKEVKDEEELLSRGVPVSTSIPMSETLEPHEDGKSMGHEESSVPLHLTPEVLVKPSSLMAEIGLQDDIARKKQSLALSKGTDAKIEDSIDTKESDVKPPTDAQNEKTSSFPKGAVPAPDPVTPEKPNRESVSKSAARLKRQRSARPRNPSSTKKKDKDFKFHSDGSDSDDVPAKKKRRKSAPTPRKTNPKIVVADTAKTPAVKAKAERSTKSALSKELSALLGDEKKHLTGAEIDLTGTKRAAAVKGRKYTPQQQQQEGEEEEVLAIAPSNVKAPKETYNRKLTTPAPSPTFDEAVSPSTKAEKPQNWSRSTRYSAPASLDETSLNAPLFKDPFADALVNKEAEKTSHDGTEIMAPKRSLRSRITSSLGTVEEKCTSDAPFDSNTFADVIVDREVELPSQQAADNAARTRILRSQRTPTPAVARNTIQSDPDLESAATQQVQTKADALAHAPAPPKERKPSYETHYGKRFTRGDRKMEEQRSAEKEKSGPMTTTPAPKKQVKKRMPVSAPTPKAVATYIAAPLTRARTRTETPVAEPALAVPKTRSQKAAIATTAPATDDKGKEKEKDKDMNQAKGAKRKTAPGSNDAESLKVSPPSKRTRAGQARKEEQEVLAKQKQKQKQKAKEMEDARPNTRAKAGRKSV